MKEHYDGEIEMREYYESIEEVHERVLPSFMNIEHMERRITKLEARKKKAPATPDNDSIGQEPLGDFLARVNERHRNLALGDRKLSGK
jgi:hypothetical protein